MTWLMKHLICGLKHATTTPAMNSVNTHKPNEKVYFFEPLEKEISVEDMQRIVDANEKLVKELKTDGCIKFI